MQCKTLTPDQERSTKRTSKIYGEGTLWATDASASIAKPFKCLWCGDSEKVRRQDCHSLLKETTAPQLYSGRLDLLMDKMFVYV